MANLRGKRILITNDDGFHAPGLAALLRVAESLSDDVWVVAPESEQSCTSHSLTTRRPLRLREFAPRRFAVDGTPTDCVILAVKSIVDGRPPDLVLSGINRGANLGEDVDYSGTVAAALEATALGIPAIAFSLARIGDETFLWDAAEAIARNIAPRLVAQAWPDGVLMNVNIPNRAVDQVGAMRLCRQGQREEGIDVVYQLDPNGRPCYWITDFVNNTPLDSDTDLAAVRDGDIAVTPLHADLTHHSALASLATGLA